MTKRCGTFDMHNLPKPPTANEDVAWDVLQDIDEQHGTTLTEDAGKGWRKVDNVKVLKETERGIRIQIGGTNIREWVPKSQLHPARSEVKKEGDEGALVVTSWWARKYIDAKDPLERELQDHKDAHEEQGVVVLTEKPKALLVRLANGMEVWFPRGHILAHSPVQHDGDSGTLVVSAWIAKEKGLVAT